MHIQHSNLQMKQKKVDLKSKLFHSALFDSFFSELQRKSGSNHESKHFQFFTLSNKTELRQEKFSFTTMGILSVD